jgi:5-dehydro-4-deoxyglucarate dehydratase
MTSPQELRDRLRNVIAFPVTPFRANLDVDFEALRHNVDWMIGHGMRVLVAAGGTGELYSLTVEETEAVHRTVIEEAAGRATVIAGVGGKLREAALLAQRAERAGADGILTYFAMDAAKEMSRARGT